LAPLVYASVNKALLEILHSSVVANLSCSTAVNFRRR